MNIYLVFFFILDLWYLGTLRNDDVAAFTPNTQSAGPFGPNRRSYHTWLDDKTYIGRMSDVCVTNPAGIIWWDDRCRGKYLQICPVLQKGMFDQTQTLVCDKGTHIRGTCKSLLLDKSCIEGLDCQEGHDFVEFRMLVHRREKKSVNNAKLWMKWSKMAAEIAKLFDEAASM